MNFRLTPKLASWDMGTMPEATFRLRWAFLSAAGARHSVSGWTPADYPSFAAAFESAQEAIPDGTLVIQGEHSATFEEHDFLSLPIAELLGVDYVGMLSTSSGAQIVGALKVKLKAESVDAYVFVNGFTYLEERK
jgi:hypothetical protein